MPGFMLDGCARLAAGFQDAARHIAGNGGNGEDDPIPRDDPRAKLYRQMHQVPIAPPLIAISSGNGITNAADLLGPNTGFHWSVRRLNLTGYSAGNVTVYRNAIQTGFGASFAVTGEILMPPSPAGTFTFGRGEMLLEPDDSLVLVATGITLNAGAGGVSVIGAADQFESWLLPDYLM